jgi:hypothetical protein
MQVATIAVVAASTATVCGQLYVVARKITRIEFKVDLMWQWFHAVSKARVTGRRKYDDPLSFIPGPVSPSPDVAHDESESDA